jgi:hypothetical protein
MPRPSPVICWDWTKAIALPRSPGPCDYSSPGLTGCLGRDALGLSHLTYQTTGTIFLHRLDHPPFPCTPNLSYPPPHVKIFVGLTRVAGAPHLDSEMWENDNPDTRHPTPHTLHPIPDTRDPTPDTRYPRPNTVTLLSTNPVTRTPPDHSIAASFTFPQHFHHAFP